MTSSLLPLHSTFRQLTCELHDMLEIPSSSFADAVHNIRPNAAKQAGLKWFLRRHQQTIRAQLLSLANANSSRRVNSDAITAHAFDWGVQLVVPRQPLRALYKAFVIVHEFGAMAGEGFDKSGVPNAAAVAMTLAVLLQHDRSTMKRIDEGQGIYLNWSWLQVPLMACPAYEGLEPVYTPIHSTPGPASAS